jgi:hypothetical protein
MSKQLKYKLKKTLKNAEFVHADLEYHEELSIDAIKGFQDEVARLLAELSEEDRQRLLERLNQAAPPSPNDENQEAQSAEEAPGPNCTDLIPTDIEEEPTEEAPPKPNKAMELKKLFHRIAELTHPDKATGSGFSENEVLRLGRIFIRAKQAYDAGNWYMLYSIAIDLGLTIDELSDEQVEWIEEDIKKTLAKIAKISNLTAWHWYVGDEEAKKLALKFYFLQGYGYDHPSL